MAESGQVAVSGKGKYETYCIFPPPFFLENGNSGKTEWPGEGELYKTWDDSCTELLDFHDVLTLSL